MKDKTKAKIEADALDYGGKGDNFGDVYIEGATPWAEWCERFEQAINGFAHEKWWPQETDKVLKEYRQWLEAK